MKKLISLLAVIVLTASVNTNTLFSQAAKKATFGKVADQDGVVRFVGGDINDFGKWRLYELNNTYSSIVSRSNSNNQVFMYESSIGASRLTKNVFGKEILLAPGADTLGIVLYLNDFIDASGNKGNWVLSSDQAGSNKRLVVSFDKKTNNTADSILLNTASWTPATYNGVPGYKYYVISWELEIPQAWCNTNSELYYTYRQGLWCTKYTKKPSTASGSFIGPVFTSPYFEDIGHAHDASIAEPNGYLPFAKIPHVEPTLKSGFTAWSTTDSTVRFGISWFPSNLENTSFIVECSQDGVIKGTRTIDPVYELVDHDAILLGNSRTDGKGDIFEFTGLKDTTLTTFEVFIVYSDGRKVSQGKTTTYTLKKNVITPIETDPVLNTVSVSEIADKTATLNLGITTGTKSGSAAVAVRVTVLDGSKVVYEGNVDIAGTPNPVNITKTVALTGLSDSTMHSYTVKLLTVEKSGSFTTLKSASSGGGTNSINTTNNSDISAYVDPAGFLQTTETQKPAMKQIYNLNGSMIANFTTKELDINHLPSGIYFLVVDNKSIKFLK